VRGFGLLRLVTGSGLAVAVIVGVPMAASASAPHTPTARTAAASGAVLGGVTPQDFPVVIELNKKGTRVVRASIALHMTCTSGAAFNVSDGYRGMRISKKRKFASSFGPETNRNSDATTTDFEGSVSGALNKARTKLSGKWQLKITDHDSAGAVTDTCDSGSVSWKAKQ
jgi:hypothetical protein